MILYRWGLRWAKDRYAAQMARRRGVSGVMVGNVPEARLSAIIDFALVVVVASAYVLCRGWVAWLPGTTNSIR